MIQEDVSAPGRMEGAAAPVIIPIVQGEESPRYLWKDLDSSKWFVSAHFVVAGTARRVSIRESKCRAVPNNAAQPSKCQRVEIYLSGLFEEETLGEVELNSLGPSPCSPEVQADRRFRGIIMVAPSLISFSPGRITPLTIPACGFLRQEALRMPGGGAEAMHLVVVNRETEKEYSGYPVFSDMPEPPPPAENPIRPEELKGIVVGIYFNFDLMEMVRLLRENGIYDAWLELGEEDSENYLRSNQVTFRLLRGDVPGAGQDNLLINNE